MEVPADGSLEDTRQMLEGKLVKAGREPRNVQVVLLEEGDGAVLRLENGEGVFFEVPRVADDVEGGGPVDGEDDGDHVDGGAREGEETHYVKCVEELEVELLLANNQMEDMRKEVSEIREQLEKEREQVANEKVRYNKLWKNYCERLSRDDELIALKQEEVDSLWRRLADSEARSPDPDPPGWAETRPVGGATKLCLPPPPSGVPSRRGKAPPIDTFGGNSSFEDWLPSLQRSAMWNAWSKGETLLQLAGHLRSRALEEWNLMDSGDKKDLSKAVNALKKRLDPGSKMLAIQDFRHASQGLHESIYDYMWHLERMFHTAYGQDEMSTETR